ncbi:MAG: lipid-A-disaccharide synthase-related protein [Gemmatimonadota bacterium]
MSTRPARDVVFLSNGHGEDSIACTIIDHLRRLPMTEGISIDGWPMVGTGEAYAERGVTRIGVRNVLPSEGFATLDARLMLGDLKAGWLGVHFRQLRSAIGLRFGYRLAVAVGDVVPIAAAVLSRAPFLHVGCAKSDYYGTRHGYTRLELHWLRRHCLLSFPRDERTTRTLQLAGVRARSAGNPMMDGIVGSGEQLVSGGEVGVTCLPGSRHAAVTNAIDILGRLPLNADTIGVRGRLHYVFAVPAGFDNRNLAARVREGEAGAWSIGAVSPRVELAAGDGSAVATFAMASLADAVLGSELVLGMAGTANEQAVGLGRPLIVLNGRGGQGAAYTRMKLRYFGAAALFGGEDGTTLERVMRRVLGDAALREEMRIAGLERMGPSGASAVIAREITHRLAIA